VGHALLTTSRFAGDLPIPAPEREIHRPIQLKLDRPNGNGGQHSDELEEDGEHPSVEKLFADLTAPPPRNPPNGKNNGRDNGHA